MIVTDLSDPRELSCSKLDPQTATSPRCQLFDEAWSDEIPPTQSLSEDLATGCALSIAAISCRARPNIHDRLPPRSEFELPSQFQCTLGLRCKRLHARRRPESRSGGAEPAVPHSSTRKTQANHHFRHGRREAD